MNIPPVEIKSSSRGEVSLLDSLSKGASADDSCGTQFADVLHASTSDASDSRNRMGKGNLTSLVKPTPDGGAVQNQGDSVKLTAPGKRPLDGALRATRSSSSIAVKTDGVNEDEAQSDIPARDQDLEAASDDKDKENAKQKPRSGAHDTSDLAGTEVVQTLLALANLPVIKVPAKPNQGSSSATGIAAIGDALGGASLTEGTGTPLATSVSPALSNVIPNNADVASNSDGAPNPQPTVTGTSDEDLDESFPDIAKGVNETNQEAVDLQNRPIIPPKISDSDSGSAIRPGPVSVRNLVVTSAGVSITSQVNLLANSQGNAPSSKDVISNATTASGASNCIPLKTAGDSDAVNQSLGSQKLSTDVLVAPKISENLSPGEEPELKSAEVSNAIPLQFSKKSDLQKKTDGASLGEISIDNSDEQVDVKNSTSDSKTTVAIAAERRTPDLKGSAISAPTSYRDAVKPALAKSVGDNPTKPSQNSWGQESEKGVVGDAKITSESEIDLSGEANQSERILASNEFDRTQPASNIVVSQTSNLKKLSDRRTLVERPLRSGVAGLQLATPEISPTPVKNVSQTVGNEVPPVSLADPSSKADADFAVWKNLEVRNSVQSRSKNLNSITSKEKASDGGGKSGTSNNQAVERASLASDPSLLTGVGMDEKGAANDFQTAEEFSVPSQSSDQKLTELPDSEDQQSSSSGPSVTRGATDPVKNSGLQTKQIHHGGPSPLISKPQDSSKLQDLQVVEASELAAMGDSKGNQALTGKAVEADSPIGRLENVPAAKANRIPGRGGIIDAQQTAQMAPGKDDDSSLESSRKNMPNSGKNDSPTRFSEPLVSPNEALRPRREVVPDKFSGVSMISNVGLDKAELNRFGGDGVGGAHGEEHLHTRLAERIWSAVESFRTSGASDWMVRIRPDQDSELNLRLRLQSNQLIVQARLGNGNWDAVATRWPELQAQLAQRGVQLRPLDGDRRNDTFPQNFNQMNSDNPPDRRQSGEFGKNQESPELDLRFLGELPERRKSPAKTAATSSAKGWEGWA